ncbi:MAG: hypothetical protein ACOH2B_05165 [Burkholderiaceae bacterium]
MKASFRLLNIGPKSEFRNYWGYPFNLLVCPQCKAFKPEPHKKYIKSSPGLHAAKISAGNPVATSTLSATGATASKKPVNKKPAANRQILAATIPPVPDTAMASRQFDSLNIQKRQYWTWGLSLFLVVLAATGVLVFSWIQPPSVSFEAVNNAGEREPTDNAPLAVPVIVNNEKKAAQIIAPIALATAQRQPAGVANVPCSPAQLALALCDAH